MQNQKYRGKKNTGGSQQSLSCPLKSWGHWGAEGKGKGVVYGPLPQSDSSSGDQALSKPSASPRHPLSLRNVVQRLGSVAPGGEDRSLWAVPPVLVGLLLVGHAGLPPPT